VAASAAALACTLAESHHTVSAHHTVRYWHIEPQKILTVEHCVECCHAEFTPHVVNAGAHIWSSKAVPEELAHPAQVEELQTHSSRSSSTSRHSKQAHAKLVTIRRSQSIINIWAQQLVPEKLPYPAQKEELQQHSSSCSSRTSS
jgi:hypothetical protein